MTHAARSGFEPLWDFLAGLYDRADREAERLNQARRTYAAAQAAYDAAKARGDTRDLHACGKALRSAKHALLALEVPRSRQLTRAERTTRRGGFNGAA